MDPQSQFCHNPDCTARGQLGLGNIRVHGRKERRYRCTTCGRPFAATRDTPFYRLKKSADLVTLVITLLCHGCPVQAIVAAFGLDERTGALSDGQTPDGRTWRVAGPGAAYWFPRGAGQPFVARSQDQRGRKISADHGPSATTTCRAEISPPASATRQRSPSGTIDLMSACLTSPPARANIRA